MYMYIILSLSQNRHIFSIITVILGNSAISMRGICLFFYIANAIYINMSIYLECND